MEQSSSSSASAFSSSTLGAPTSLQASFSTPKLLPRMQALPGIRGLLQRAFFLTVGLFAIASLAQQPPQDPLINLMLSQPPIELNAPVTATASFDPPVVIPGQLSVYRVTFNALGESIQLPAELPADPNLGLQRSAEGEVMQMGAGSIVPTTGFNYRAHPSSVGDFVVTQFVATVYGKPVEVPAAQLTVAASLPPDAQPAQQIALEMPETNLFVGQPAKARVLSQGNEAGNVQFLNQVQLTGDGILADQGAISQRVERLPHASGTVPTYIYETILTPLKSGKLNVAAQGFTAGFHASGPVVITGGPITISGGPPRYTLLDSAPLDLQVKPLPREGQLPGFTGAIGVFTLDPPKLATNVLKAGEPVELTAVIRGEGDFTRLVAPVPPSATGWQILASDPSVTPGSTAPAPAALPPPPPKPGSLPQGAATFHFTLIPVSEDVRATPPIPFSFFDADRGAYVDLTIPSLPVTVNKGAISAETAAVVQTEADAGEEEKLALSGLAPAPGRTAAALTPLQLQPWFPLAQLAPAFALGGLWVWDRRRRYLERHPDIVLRRRALQALRRHRRAARQAARLGDARAFASSAVRAMQAGSAPHYPAEPAALVGGDILQVLQTTGLAQPAQGLGRATDTVKRIFAITDASQFSEHAQDSADAVPQTGTDAPKELISLQPEIEEVLRNLEEKLCPA